ncbi:hypothetical protein JY452_05470 [Stenotrophomonas maltophilia]|uniref:hypothetical protein n=1 Tax=Stenotrophomonas TaxID=40323 RepID=UPI0015DFAD4D|nr:MULTISPECIES: hypothetical protein [Stenotrophomonas]MBA0274424.1 hypothetical protein [Stenotrophomonas maltophilia]MBN5125448.1 hypothetical protein [Stenotrophomonas maltophilia]MDQ7275691.1 hypothetical protein [Stenotrophomonas sp. Sm3147]MDQ7284864.1 hypothetical protein [Stenotrophomonas sp. Sm5341]
MDTIELHGLTFKVEHIPDPDAGAPWENNDTLGTVSGWECRDHYRGGKRPGERILNKGDRHRYRFYDYAGAVAKGRREGMTGPEAAEAADREFEWLRAWCEDRWSYIGVQVTLLDAEGNDTEHSDALWGVDDDGDYAKTVANDLALEIGARVNWDDVIEVPARTIVLRAPKVAA